MVHIISGLLLSNNYLLLEPFLAKNKIDNIARAVRRISIPELYQPKSTDQMASELIVDLKYSQSSDFRHCFRNISMQMPYQT